MYSFSCILYIKLLLLFFSFFSSFWAACRSNILKYSSRKFESFNYAPIDAPLYAGCCEFLSVLRIAKSTCVRRLRWRHIRGVHRQLQTSLKQHQRACKYGLSRAESWPFFFWSGSWMMRNRKFVWLCSLSTMETYRSSGESIGLLSLDILWLSSEYYTVFVCFHLERWNWKCNLSLPNALIFVCQSRLTIQQVPHWRAPQKTRKYCFR